jgi:hypothetical protein
MYIQMIDDNKALGSSTSLENIKIPIHLQIYLNKKKLQYNLTRQKNTNRIK